MIKSLYEIFGERVKLDITSSRTRYALEDCFARDPYFPEESHKVVFSHYNEEADEDEPFAFLILNVQQYEDIEEAYDIADHKGGDEYDSTEYACKYLKDNASFLDEMTELEQRITICEMHNLYISPKYRGRGISEAIKLILPKILFEIGYGDAVFVTYINPFTVQTDITEKTSLCAESFGGYVNNGEIDKNLLEVMEKSLKKCGFKDVGDRHYAATTLELIDVAEKEMPVFSPYLDNPPYYDDKY